ncbi:extracellular catalytic domain type 1 short-chain-length polyhydroxyalkanoate depolymerase [Paraburkholderia bonniea]|uniref:extracellular catalytic domain type 1 short-chain-length polyhydroxyalkanoate depolymerase n=1 Tax=Paraburkholderia bonniea TaxID=2152891 RepID=UPI001292760D|nr:PHB depolymerase family esterase [Paraburkholderia bonniea]
MARSLTKLWTSGLQRLVEIQTRQWHTATQQPPPAATKAAKRTAGPPAQPTPRQNKNSSGPIRDVTHPATEARESRVRPRAAAWANGEWTRSFHSAPPAPGRLVNHLAYGLYIPAGRALAQMPLVVMLHGCKQSIEAFAEGTRMNLLADRFGFAVVYPEQSKHAHPHRCWHWYDTGDHAGENEARAVVSLVDALLVEHEFDGERVYIAGLSAGAGLATQLALRYPWRFAAVALHSGPAFGEARSAIAAMDVMRRGVRHDPVALVEQALDVAAYPGMPALVLQGTDDRVVAAVNATQLTAALAHLNRFTALDPVYESTADGVIRRDYVRDGRAVVQLCEVPGLGHAWSGGDDTVPFHSAIGPDASVLLWEFFSQQRRRAARASTTPATPGVRPGDFW